jgi:hypothetical protein
MIAVFQMAILELQLIRKIILTTKIYCSREKEWDKELKQLQPHL